MDPLFHPAILAIITGDFESLGDLLRASPDLARRRSSCGHPTLLQLVACEASTLPDPLGAAAILVEAGADLAEPLVAAASVDAREVLVFLLDQGIGVDGEGVWTPLDEAVYWRHLELAEWLVSRGAQVGSLRVAAGLGHAEAVETFFTPEGLTASAGPVRSPFPDTVPSDRAKAVQAILDNAFVMAVNNSWREVAGTLLERGAQVNSKPPGFHWRGTALHAAVWQGDQALVEWLLSCGADPRVRDDHVNSDGVGWANHHGHPHLAALLQAHSVWGTG